MDNLNNSTLIKPVESKPYTPIYQFFEDLIADLEATQSQSPYQQELTNQ